MIKNGVLDCVLKKQEFQWIFDAKTQRLDFVENEFGRCPVWVVTKFDEKWVPEWSPKIIKIEPLGAHGHVF